MKWAVVVLLALCVCCSKSSRDESSNREVNAKYQSLVERFGDSIAQKDYRSAYELTSANLRKELTYDEFVETWKPYRDTFVGEVETEYTPSDDPKEMEEFVPESERHSLVEEITIEFSGTIDGEEAEFYCNTWVIDDGTPSIASFYVED